ncbi:MAG: putative ABC exporter domain-containing protein [Pseudoxanthomonas sp.]
MSLASASAPTSAPAGSRFGAMAGAFVYLQATSLYNNLRRRLLRLRQPKYLVGALAGGAYLYFFFIRKVFVGGAAAAHAPFETTPAMTADFAALAAILLALYVLADWLFSGDRARLAFSEAEVAFLFPAPLTRTALIQFSLLRSQLGIFFSSFLIGLLLRRGGALGGHPLQYATGLWLVMSTLKLHSLAASFTRERLLGLGVTPWLRRVALVVVVLLVAFACWWPMRASLVLPDISGGIQIDVVRRWFEGVVGAAPLSWLLAPFRWMVAPIFAGDGMAFLRALGPALALLVLHYLWAVRAQVSFEDASIAHARRRAEKVAALREGRLGQRMPSKPRGEPFKLAAQGHPAVAFLWKGLLAMGPFYRLHTWLIAAVALTALCQWLAADPALRGLLAVLGTVVTTLGLWLVFLGPMLTQHGLRRTFERMDVLKATPLRGWQIALGELSTPAAVMSFAVWLLLLVGAQALAAKGGQGVLGPGNIVALAAGMAVLAPPLCGLMLCVPFAGMLYFPAWIVAPGSAGTGGGQGFEVMGQRMVFMLGYVVTVMLAALPAVVAGGLGFLLANWVAGLGAGALAAALCASVVLAFELYFALRLLGRRIDGFDLSQELR